MSQIEHNFRQFLAKKPEIEKCYSVGLINRRSLARYLIEQKAARGNQLDATIAMLRRFDFRKSEEAENANLQFARVAIKDNILILDIEKEKSAVHEVQKIMSSFEYDKGDTLKIVIGSSSLTLYIDKHKEKDLKQRLSHVKISRKIDNASEISLLFTNKAISTKGILSLITREFLLNDITITELLTASSELLIYINEKDVVKAYDILKQLRTTV